jgi:hypothetical protein
MCYVEVLDKITNIDLKVTNVHGMQFPFPLFDIIVYSCQHLYHLWYVAILFKVANNSKEE